MAHEHDGGVDPLFSQAMAKLAAAWDARLTEARIRSYARGLADIPMLAVLGAMARAIREAPFFPSVAQLRGYVDATPDDEAVLAWAALRDAASAVGAYGSVELDGCAAAAVRVVFGGWPQFCAECDETHGGWGIRRQEFLAAYRAARRTAVVGTNVLPGLAERAQPVSLLSSSNAGRAMALKGESY